MNQRVKENILVSDRLARMMVAFEQIGTTIKTLNTTAKINLSKLPTVSETGSHIREPFLIRVKRHKVIRVGALSQHPNQMKSPGNVFQLDKFLAIVRMDLDRQIQVTRQLEYRLVLNIENATPRSNRVHIVSRQAQQSHVELFHAPFNFPDRPSHVTRMNNEPGGKLVWVIGLDLRVKIVLKPQRLFHLFQSQAVAIEL